MRNELSRAVGKEVMGLWVYYYDKDVAEACYYMLCAPRIDPIKAGRDGERGTEAEAWADCPPYEYDPAAAAEIPVRMAELNLKVAYVLALAEIKGAKQPYVPMEAFELLSATPAEMCNAALAVVRSRALAIV